MNAYGKTDKGLVRANNQDTFLIQIRQEDGMGFVVLCDGMGGARAGNVASQKAAECFMESISKASADNTETEELSRIVEQAVVQANQLVYELAISDEVYAGMGTTLVGGICVDDRVILANVGDSRAYMMDGTRIAQMTSDHSLVAELVRTGRLSPSEAKDYPGRNLITRAIGVDAEVEADLYEITVHDGQTLLLCSDGLCGLISDMEIAHIAAAASSQEEACDTLIARACSAGGTDNITVVLYTK